MKRYRIITIDLLVEPNRINRSGLLYKRKAVSLAKAFSKLDSMTSITLVQKKVRHGWMRIWPDKGPIVTDVES